MKWIKVDSGIDIFDYYPKYNLVDHDRILVFGKHIGTSYTNDEYCIRMAEYDEGSFDDLSTGDELEVLYFMPIESIMKPNKDNIVVVKDKTK